MSENSYAVLTLLHERDGELTRSNERLAYGSGGRDAESILAWASPTLLVPGTRIKSVTESVNSYGDVHLTAVCLDPVDFPEWLKPKAKAGKFLLSWSMDQFALGAQTKKVVTGLERALRMARNLCRKQAVAAAIYDGPEALPWRRNLLYSWGCTGRRPIRRTDRRDHAEIDRAFPLPKAEVPPWNGPQFPAPDSLAAGK